MAVNSYQIAICNESLEVEPHLRVFTGEPLHEIDERPRALPAVFAFCRPSDTRHVTRGTSLAVIVVQAGTTTYSANNDDVEAVGLLALRRSPHTRTGAANMPS